VPVVPGTAVVVTDVVLVVVVVVVVVAVAGTAEAGVVDAGTALVVLTGATVVEVAVAPPRGAVATFSDFRGPEVL
jgi:hypothetical protein